MQLGDRQSRLGLAAPPQAGNYQALKELGDCHAAMGQSARAKEYYLQAAAAEPERGGSYVGLGALAIEAGNLDAAEDAFQLAVRLDEHCPEGWAGLAMIRQQHNDHEAAQEMYLRCLQLDSDNMMALLGLFQTSCRMGSFARIIYYLETYLRRHPDDASVLFCLATLEAREGRLARARDLLIKVLALEPDKPQAAAMLADVLRRLAQART